MTQEKIKNKWLNGIQLDGLYTFDEAIEKVKTLEGQRIPNNEDWKELFDNTSFSFDKEKKEGVFTFQDKTEIRLPAMGHHYNDTRDTNGQGSSAHYWSLLLEPLDSIYASYMFFNSAGKLITYTNYRAYGFSVRCVKDIKSSIRVIDKALDKKMELTYEEKSKILNDAFMYELKKIFNKYNAHMTAKDEYMGYAECGEDIHIRIESTIEFNEPFLDIDLGSYFE